MSSSFFRASGLAALACAVLVISAGCAEQRAPIDRVQAMALSKHFFVGASLSDPSDDPQFYMGSRIIDEPYGVGQDMALVQALGSIARVRFEIQENVVLARLTYDRIQNTSGGNTWGATATSNGQVVAEFNIESHFDIIRDYNPQTGEQLNVVVENTTDRPWYEREFFRVDWSKNLVTDAYDFDVLAQAQLFGVQFDSLNYYIQDPSDPNAPVYSDADGYLDVTQKVFATPQMVDTPFGTFPSCFITANSDFPGGMAPALTCNPAELTVRLAFKKVVDTDYEPEDFTGPKMAAFGWFTEDRYGYDRNYGILDQNWHRFASRYNIWKGSHIQGSQCAVDYWRDDRGNVQNYKVDANGKYVFDPATGLPIPDPAGQPFTLSAVGKDVHRDDNGNKTEDECEFRDGSGTLLHKGSRCDEFTNKCDLPLYERTVKTIPFYFGPGAAPDLFPSTSHALNDWNLAVKRASQLGKQVEATRVGQPLPGTAPFLTSEADLANDQQGGKTVPDVFVLCHNPVLATDDPACGATGLAVRRGDMRYNLVDVIPNPQYPSPWGIMTDFNDPLTGEKVQGSINEWRDALDLATQATEDLLRWINGEISNQDIASGQYLQQWVAVDRIGTASHKPAVLATDEIQRRAASIDKSGARLNGLVPGVPLGAAMTAAAQNLATALGPSLDGAFEGTRQALIGTTWEAQLMTPDNLQLAGLNPNAPAASADGGAGAGAASVLRGLNPRLQKWSRALLDRAYASKGMCMDGDAPEPDSLVGFARQAAALFPLPAAKDVNYPAKLYTRQQALHQWLREQFHMSVIAHEMGHSMGLRHNFAGSYDALNYHTEYWQLRTRNGQEHYCGYPGALDPLTPHTSGTDCVGPRWVDPVTEQETNDLIWKWGSSTVMDYPGDQTQDTNDIGPYDKAAMRFGYAEVVDVEQNLKAVVASGGGTAGSGYDFVGGLQLLDGWGGIYGFPYGTTLQTLSGGEGGNHYSTYADKYGVLGPGCGTVRRPGYNGDPNSPLAYVCSGPSLDFVAVRDMKSIAKVSRSDLQSNASNIANFAVDATNRVRHPYMFAGDEFADVGNVPVFRFDAGADAYEQMEYLITTYENRYVFNNFRRDRVMFDSWGALTRVETRYWDKIQGMTKSLALGVEELTTQGGLDPTTQAGLLLPLALGASDGLAMFARAMTRPEPGTYDTAAAGPGGPPNTWGAVGTALGSRSKLQFGVALGSGEGRYVHNDYDYTQGYWWSDYQTQSGSGYEKSRAPIYLTEAYNDFVSNAKDDYIDGRYKNLSYLSIYPEQVRRLFANLMATQSATLSLDNGTAAQIFTVAPYVVPGAGGATQMNTVQYLPWEWYDPNDPSTQSLQYPQGAVLLDPLVGWEQQYPSLLHLFWYGRTALSLDFVDMVRILSPGDAGSDALLAAATVRYRDPVTGVEYVAKSYGSEWVNPAIGFQVEKGIGARMLQHANYLASLAYLVTQPADPTTGELTYATDAQGNAIPLASQAAQDAAALLKAYASNLDYARKLTLFLGYIPPVPSNHP